jgi:hypothetical protein|tara:strand:- start:2011 stop:2616 length:606 start_codon:yes stop_codon:yes gene_type:complete
MKLKDIKKLSPEERIERLKEMAEKNKKEIEEAQEMIKESAVDIEEERKEKELIPIPQLRSADKSGLSLEEKGIFNIKRYEREETEEGEEREEEHEPTPLEETVEQENITEEAKKESEAGQYFRNLTDKQLTEKAGELYNQAKENEDYLPRDKQAEEENIYKEIKRREEENTGENYKSDVARELDRGQEVLDALGRNYKKMD